MYARSTPTEFMLKHVSHWDSAKAASTFTFGEKCDCSEANKSENNTVSPLKNGMLAAVAAVAAVAVAALMLDGIVNNFDCFETTKTFSLFRIVHTCAHSEIVISHGIHDDSIC